MKNLLLHTDVYKMGHMTQYEPNVTHIFSTLQVRSNKKYREVVNFGMQALLREYLAGYAPTQEHIDEFMDLYQKILGKFGDTEYRRLREWRALNYTPLHITQVPEGTRVNVPNILGTIHNTRPGFHWLVGFVESLLLKVWATSTVASKSLDFYKTAKYYGLQTCDNLDHLPFAVHDFGYRGVSSEETAASSGAAHLLAFRGSDTILAFKHLQDYYDAEGFIGASVPATEHSVVESYGPYGEKDMILRMLRQHPTGIISLVSDTYDFWRFLNVHARELRDVITARDGKVVFRPDSGDPEKIILGDPRANTAVERMGALRLLNEIFGSTANGKHYDVLNPKVGLIYGDGFYLERYERVLQGMKEAGFASSNLVIGVGGLLLQHVNRDDIGFAFKATAAQYNNDGDWKPIFKDPVTDPGKKSYRGVVKLVRNPRYPRAFETVDWGDEGFSVLKTAFLDGVITDSLTLEQVRANLRVKEVGL